MNYSNQLNQYGCSTIKNRSAELQTGNCHMTTIELLWHHAGQAYLYVAKELHDEYSDLNFDSPLFGPRIQRERLTNLIGVLEQRLSPVAIEFAHRGNPEIGTSLKAILTSWNREIAHLREVASHAPKNKRTQECLKLYRIATRETLEELLELCDEIRAEIGDLGWGYWRDGDKYRHGADLQD